ncbi:hypothetical protein LOAG_07459 [Loa loa]|uniref:Uncharacterized protein n=1 Tax=Loa loa TaxID=7209 RepID=A0A1S0TVV1_LOALO|nr:hypothetical protein LOAG_07459 [Loa loa]EFO21031.1 hypothetical protein LOAG_07459 [Loa loa]
MEEYSMSHINEHQQYPLQNQFTTRSLGAKGGEGGGGKGGRVGPAGRMDSVPAATATLPATTNIFHCVSYRSIIHMSPNDRHASHMPQRLSSHCYLFAYLRLSNPLPPTSRPIHPMSSSSPTTNRRFLRHDYIINLN